MTRRWSVVTAGLLAGVGIFQAGLAAGRPWGAAAYGGAHPGELPTTLRTVSAGAAIGYAALAAFVGSGAGHPQARRGILTGLCALMTIGTGLNAISRSPVERVWAPVAALTAVAAWRARSESSRS